MADVEIPLTDLAAEEEELQFAASPTTTPGHLGTALVAAARRESAPGRRRHHPQRPPALPRRPAGGHAGQRRVDRAQGPRRAPVRAQLAVHAPAGAAEGTTVEEKFGLDPRSSPPTGGLPDPGPVGGAGRRRRRVRAAPGGGPPHGGRRPARPARRPAGAGAS